MSFNYNQILNIPERCLLNKRLTKAFFLKNFDLSGTEKKLLNSIINEMEWVASIKLSNANIPPVKNTEYAFEEVQIMQIQLPLDKFSFNAENSAILIQKYIPYQLILIIENDNEFLINACDKRINQNDLSKRTIENYYFTNSLSKLYHHAHAQFENIF